MGSNGITKFSELTELFEEDKRHERGEALSELPLFNSVNLENSGIPFAVPS
jgi:hypothetical protein